MFVDTKKGIKNTTWASIDEKLRVMEDALPGGKVWVEKQVSPGGEKR